MTEIDLKSAAFYEAGRAVMAAHHNLSVHKVIVNTNGGGSRIDGAYAGLVWAFKRNNKAGPAFRELRFSARQASSINILVALAGAASIALFLEDCSSVISQSDFKELESNVIQQLKGNLDSAKHEDYCGRKFREAVRILFSRRDAVKRVAAALLTHGSLNRNQFSAAYEGKVVAETV